MIISDFLSDELLWQSYIVVLVYMPQDLMQHHSTSVLAVLYDTKCAIFDKLYIPALNPTFEGRDKK